MRPDGSRQLLAFLRSQGESQAAWAGLLLDLYRRGLVGKTLLLIVTDGCPGLTAARKTYHRFGQFSQALEKIRARIEREPVEKRELDRILGQMGVPGDFDVSQITWRPDHDPFFYEQLARRARRQYLFREQYIFDVPNGVVVETPQLGHATYLFARPARIEAFLALYTRVSKEDIRRNRENVAARLGFLGRIVHGVKPRGWVKELRSRLGETVDYAQVSLKP